MIYIILIFIIFSIYIFFPKPSNKIRAPYEAILLLGCPTLDNGKISQLQQERCDQACALYKGQIATIIVISGGCVKNQFHEARTMQSYILSKLPDANILIEQNAKNTYQNLRYTNTSFSYEKILIVTSPFHIRRAAFFAKKFYQDFDVIGCKKKDSIKNYILEYPKLWICMYYELKLNLKKS